ncbi:MAG: 16S rRNA (guanine(527)-N(7))-methyltransferase RsmG [Coriobacteriaceae bacterium]|nr:16S rRNA (guanine(527)-N(7))-methyltransferase RsmG [Coriobacteriaceae bacterium]
MGTTVNSRRAIELKTLEISEGEFRELQQELLDDCKMLDIEITEEQASLCLKHLLYVNQVNKYMNLTRIKDIHEALVLHIVDSLALAKDLPIEPERFLDMGTGAGFPGIPFAIMTGSEGVLLDSVGKKIDAVNTFIGALGLEGIEGIHDRCESFATKQKGAFDIVFARAVGQMPMIIEYGTPFLEDDGYLVVAKANPSSDEVKSSEMTADICGLELVGKDEFDLPFELGHRTVFLFQKVSSPRVRLPRAVGLAKRQPLG